MNKVEVFEKPSLLAIKSDINNFAMRHEIIDVSITTSMAGYTTYYTAIVLYKE